MSGKDKRNRATGITRRQKRSEHFLVFLHICDKFAFDDETMLDHVLTEST